MYPIKNLEDLYDRKAIVMISFDKNDKGTWIINSEMVIQPNNEDMVAKGMVLYMNGKYQNNKWLLLCRCD